MSTHRSCSKSLVRTQKSPIWHLKEPYVSSKDPYVSSKEPFVPSKEPILHLKEPYVHSKEHLCTQKSAIYTKKSAIYTQKSPRYTQKRPTYTAKSPMNPQTSKVNSKESYLPSSPLPSSSQPSSSLPSSSLHLYPHHLPSSSDKGEPLQAPAEAVLAQNNEEDTHSASNDPFSLSLSESAHRPPAVPPLRLAMAQVIVFAPFVFLSLNCTNVFITHRPPAVPPLRFAMAQVSLFPRFCFFVWTGQCVRKILPCCERPCASCHAARLLEGVQREGGERRLPVAMARGKRLSPWQEAKVSHHGKRQRSLTKVSHKGLSQTSLTKVSHRPPACQRSLAKRDACHGKRPLKVCHRPPACDGKRPLTFDKRARLDKRAPLPLAMAQVLPWRRGYSGRAVRDVRHGKRQTGFDTRAGLSLLLACLFGPDTKLLLKAFRAGLFPQKGHGLYGSFAESDL